MDGQTLVRPPWSMHQGFQVPDRLTRPGRCVSAQYSPQAERLPSSHAHPSSTLCGIPPAGPIDQEDDERTRRPTYAQPAPPTAMNRRLSMEWLHLQLFSKAKAKTATLARTVRRHRVELSPLRFLPRPLARSGPPKLPFLQAGETWDPTLGAVWILQLVQLPASNTPKIASRDAAKGDDQAAVAAKARIELFSIPCPPSGPAENNFRVGELELIRIIHDASCSHGTITHCSPHRACIQGPPLLAGKKTLAR